MMDAFSDPDVEEVVIMACTQIGKTECLNNVVGFFIEHDPSPIMVVQPTIAVGPGCVKTLAARCRAKIRLNQKLVELRSVC